MVVLPSRSDSQLTAAWFQSASDLVWESLVQALPYCVCPEEGGQFRLHILTAIIF